MVNCDICDNEIRFFGKRNKHTFENREEKLLYSECDEKQIIISYKVEKEETIKSQKVEKELKILKLKR
jgi:hypothetical protein